MTIYRINAGKYRQVITFQKNMGTRNSYGERTNDNENWQDFFQTRASILPVSGKEVLQPEFINSEITHRILIRYTKQPINSQMRIKYGDRTFTIIAPPIDYQERHLEFQILCKEVL